MDEQPEVEAPASEEQSIDSDIEPDELGEFDEAVEETQEPPKVAEPSVVRSGIETPRGTLTRKVKAQTEALKPQIKPSRKQTVGL